jgi:DNA invertase Pin-like site-specific DNA recombinase
VGRLPLGYDVRERLLVVNEVEAKLVRRIFDDFVSMRSATLMAKAYGAEGVVTKGGKPFTKQTTLQDAATTGCTSARSSTRDRASPASTSR